MSTQLDMNVMSFIAPLPLTMFVQRKTLTLATGLTLGFRQIVAGERGHERGHKGVSGSRAVLDTVGLGLVRPSHPQLPPSPSRLWMMGTYDDFQASPCLPSVIIIFCLFLPR